VKTVIIRTNASDGVYLYLCIEPKRGCVRANEQGASLTMGPLTEAELAAINRETCQDSNIGR